MLHSVSFVLGGGVRIPFPPIKQPKLKLNALSDGNSFQRNLKEKFDVYAISDLHTDIQENFVWTQELSKEKYKDDVLIVAGDITHNVALLKRTLKALLERFCHVAFVPGNHELWVKNTTKKSKSKQPDSIEKLGIVMKLCQELGVITEPTKLNNLWIVPIFSWHHQGFDEEPDMPGFKTALANCVSDYRFCNWERLNASENTHGADELALYFDQLNPEVEISTEKCDVISFSHFVPLQELIPEKRFLRVPYLTKVAGSKYLHERIKALKSDIHVFGHTHIAWDIHINGTRYVQCPLGQPRERRSRPRTMISVDNEWDPRLQITSTKLSSNWDGVAATWLPVKIYTHYPEADQSKGQQELKRPNNMIHSDDLKVSSEARNKQTLRAGKMHESFAFWSEYYKAKQRDPEVFEKGAHYTFHS